MIACQLMCDCAPALQMSSGIETHFEGWFVCKPELVRDAVAAMKARSSWFANATKLPAVNACTLAEKTFDAATRAC
jgi:hypothetical protein